MCPYYSSTGQEYFRDIGNDLFDSLMNQLALEEGFQMLVLSLQNEPLVDPKLIKRCQQFKKIMPNKKLEIVTNGSLLNETLAADIYAVADRVSISVNAFKEETYETVMNGLRWRTIENNLNSIAQHRDWVDKTVLRFIKQRENYREAKDFKIKWNKKGFCVFGFDINSRLGSVEKYESLRISPTFSKRLSLTALKYLSKLLLPYCPIPFLTFYIRSDGDVVLCFNDWSRQHSFGNVHSQSIREIYNSPHYEEVRHRAIRGNYPDDTMCRKCELFNQGLWLTIS